MRLQSKLFEEAKEAKVLLRIIPATFIMLLMMILGGTVGELFVLIISLLINGTRIGGAMALDFLSSIHGQLLSFGFPLLMCFLWVSLIEKRKLSSLGLKAKGSVKNFLEGFALGFILFSLITFLMYIFNVISLEEGISMGIKSLKSIVLILPPWILQSSTEEVLSRGWLMHIVGARYRPMVGFVLSSTIFGFLHILNPGVSILSIVNIIIVGFMLGLYVIYKEDLWGACGIHAAWNFTQGNIFGFKVSGLEADTYSLIRFSNKGSDFLTGGAFGPEASIFASLVTIAFTIFLVMKLKNGKKDKDDDLGLN